VPNEQFFGITEPGSLWVVATALDTDDRASLAKLAAAAVRLGSSLDIERALHVRSHAYGEDLDSAL
jgi:hypothetical protein